VKQKQKRKALAIDCLKCRWKPTCARTLSETRGFLKALVDARSDRILGFTAVGVGAGEIMAAIQVAMIGKLPYTALRDAVLTHPTLVEGLIQLFSSVPSARDVSDETSKSAA